MRVAEATIHRDAGDIFTLSWTFFPDAGQLTVDVGPDLVFSVF